DTPRRPVPVLDEGLATAVHGRVEAVTDGPHIGGAVRLDRAEVEFVVGVCAGDQRHQHDTPGGAIPVQRVCLPRLVSGGDQEIVGSDDPHGVRAVRGYRVHGAGEV